MSILATLVLLNAELPPTIGPLLARPIETFECVLHDQANEHYPLLFKVIGGQGILVDGRLRDWTPRRIEVLSDPRNLISDFPDQYQEVDGINRGKGNQGFGWKQPGSFKIGMYIEVHKVGNERDSVVTLHDGWSGNFSATGICKHEQLDQQPIQKQSSVK
ncbi:MAG: hypothetical protein GW808_06485 [Sphingomonadales bacterium]|nr:hypothetical protein [Sphingomonadales bacterium]NCO48973.1 hypothetical protein [Sphingomonadales bacterium]NCP01708.1 hypothetical protein [Sphingomonadales bacterium]NCP26045.1 hypothetical protein [Sphingomonadales bacterium]NCP44438.1 hypothetical protein [Sphingomonadales bacterium]